MNRALATKTRFDACLVSQSCRFSGGAERGTRKLYDCLTSVGPARPEGMPCLRIAGIAYVSAIHLSVISHQMTSPRHRPYLA
jgi:hypothetical protein